MRKLISNLVLMYFMHRELDKEVLRKLENFSRVKGNNEDNVWKLNAH